MKSTILMILLVTGDSGEVRSSFAVQEDMETCLNMSAGIREVFKQIKTEIIELDCVKSQQKYSKFHHNVPKDAPRYHYLVDYGKTIPKIRSMANLAACQTEKNALPKGKAYCTISTQKLLD